MFCVFFSKANLQSYQKKLFPLYKKTLLTHNMANIQTFLKISELLPLLLPHQKLVKMEGFLYRLVN